ncbi:type I pullulanase [Rossellomorea sp. BNER]|uniref:type I pullulanase n=1 Tax=Rossellomorea sp. BNER TaxID=2962031 RepID=UPI003AF267DC|nr:type I pullulanase [Rossellomorea sp. BNER]
MLSIKRDFFAYLDRLDLITVLLPYSYNDGHSSFFKLIHGKEEWSLPILETITLHDQKKYVCKSEHTPQFGKNYLVQDENGQTTDLQIGAVIRTQEFDEMFYYEGNDLGAVIHQNETSFKVWAPTATKVSLKLKNPKTNEISKIPLVRNEKGVWSTMVLENVEGHYYTYLVCVNLQWQETIDPYARSVTINSEWGCVIDSANTKVDLHPLPSLPSPTDAIIYELHVRDFSIHKDSGMRHKGKYLAFTEKNTEPLKGKSTGVTYLKELGITHVELLPVNDFAGVLDENPNKQYNWGYNPLYFQSPEGSYSTNPADPYIRIIELKELIASLHQEGLRVIIDVVFNHVYIREDSSFEKLVPGYYFRHDVNGLPSNGTGVGNDFGSERLMARKFIVDSIEYWLTEYGVDGFRFDLMGILDVETMNEVKRKVEEIKPQAIIIGEGWDLNTPLPLELKANIKNASKLEGIGQFNDRFRDWIKGSTFNLYDRGFALGHGQMEHKAGYVLMGSIGLKKDEKGIFLSPTQSVNYVESHDNHTLWDKTSACIEGENWGRKHHKLATAMVLMANGIPFLHAGQEFFRTKKGVENSYNAPDDINQFDWEKRVIYHENIEYIKGLISIRKAHGAFRFSSSDFIHKYVHFGSPKEKLVTLHYKNVKEFGPWNELFLIYYAGNETTTISLPSGSQYGILADVNRADLLPMYYTEGNCLKVEPVALYICVR